MNLIIRDWTVEERTSFLQEKYSLSKQKTLLELEHYHLNNLKISLQNKQTELESLCQNPDSQKKIELIAASILKKIFKFVRILARFTDNNLEIDKTWELMSELDKDELRHKKILRES